MKVTPEQCADPAERIRLWQEHGVQWVRAPAPAPPGDELDLAAWYAAHPEVANIGRCQAINAHAGERCAYRRQAGSRYCGVYRRQGEVER